MRLIDADALPIKFWGDRFVVVAKVDIENAPTVDAVKHGHWDNKIIEFDVPHTVARCSNCKGKIWVYAENYEVKYPYCPLCGAKMDEVKDESHKV